MIESFEQWTDHTKAPKWARPVSDLIYNAKPVTILSPTIEAHLGICGSAVRIAVHYCRCTMRMPIGSEGGGKGKKGYFWAEFAEDLDISIHAGRQRANSIQAWVDELTRTQAHLPLRDGGDEPFMLEFSP